MEGKPLVVILTTALKLAWSGISALRESRLKDTLAQEEELKKSLGAIRSVRDEVRLACMELARHRHELGVGPAEEPLWRRLADDGFQSDLAEWLSAGDLAEGEAAKTRLRELM